MMVTNTTPGTNTTSQHFAFLRAAALSRRSYASLPFGFRLAGATLVLAADLVSTFGAVVYAEFIRNAVRGMPDTRMGIPALDFIQVVTEKGADALPMNYGRPFAARVYKILLSKFGIPMIAEEAMSNVMYRAAQGKIRVSNGSSLHEAESYVITSAMNAARDILRSQQRHREVSLVRDDDDNQGRDVDISDPRSFERLELLPSQVARIMTELRKVHERAPAFVEALLEGESHADIADIWNVTPSYVSKWLRTYGDGIKRVIEHQLRAASWRDRPFRYTV